MWPWPRPSGDTSSSVGHYRYLPRYHKLSAFTQSAEIGGRSKNQKIIQRPCPWPHLSQNERIHSNVGRYAGVHAIFGGDLFSHYCSKCVDRLALPRTLHRQMNIQTNIQTDTHTHTSDLPKTATYRRSSALISRSVLNHPSTLLIFYFVTVSKLLYKKTQKPISAYKLQWCTRRPVWCPH